MDLKQLELMQQELMDEIDKEAEIENSIVESSKAIAQELFTKKRTRAIIDEKTFSLAYHNYMGLNEEKKESKFLCIIAINEFNFKFSQGNYRPYKVEAEYDSEYSEAENLEMIVESFIRHLAGVIKPEEIQ